MCIPEVDYPSNCPINSIKIGSKDEIEAQPLFVGNILELSQADDIYLGFTRQARFLPITEFHLTESEVCILPDEYDAWDD